jgi:acyl-CoA reductase-like NAD-dependent aldehyde dehydrogenase
MGHVSTPFWVAGKPASSPNTTVVRNPFDGSVAGEHDVPDAEDVERAVRAAAEVSAETAALPAHARADALDHVSRALDARRDELAELITAESGKPVKWSRVEVGEGPASAMADFTEEQVTVFTGLPI